MIARYQTHLKGVHASGWTGLKAFSDAPQINKQSWQDFDQRMTREKLNRQARWTWDEQIGGL